MADFLPAFERTLTAEGGYKLTDIAADRGGQTYAGLSRKNTPNWPGWHHIDQGRTPPTPLVRDYYKTEYWDRVRGDEIVDQRIAETLYDFGVNAGWKTSAKLAQAVLGATPDGTIGPKTLELLNAADANEFLPLFALAKIKRYADIVKKDKTQSKFLLGWINRTLESLA